MPRFLDALVTLYCADIAAAERFYGQVLGLTETYRFPRTGAAEHIEYRLGTATIAVSSPAGLQAHGMPAATRGHPFEIGIQTDDLDAVLADLRQSGVVVLKAPSLSAAGNRYAYIADPDGNWISLYQHAQAVPPASGPGA